MHDIRLLVESWPVSNGLKAGLLHAADEVPPTTIHRDRAECDLIEAFSDSLCKTKK
jgi:hypothetical protein